MYNNVPICLWQHGCLLAARGATSTGYQHGWYYSVPELNVHYIYIFFFFMLLEVKTIDLEKETGNILQILILCLNF